jgi:hypothetical protein
MNTLPSVELQLYRAADLLAPIRDRLVFVGGIVRGLLVTDPAVDGPRPTDDADTIIEVSTLLQYQEFEAQLRTLGFKNDMRPEAPICRYVHGTLTLDVMPTEPVLGFSNRWYPHAHSTACTHEISIDGRPPLKILVVSASSFLATKLVSYADRGQGDWCHRDLEDIVVLVDGRPSLLEELECETPEMRRYVGDEISRLLASDLEQYVPGHLPQDVVNKARVPIVLTRLRRIGRCATIAQLGEEVRLSHGGNPGAAGQTNGAWTYVVHDVQAQVKVPRQRPKGMHVAVFARLTNHGTVSGTTGDGRDVHIEDAFGIRHPPNYGAICSLRDLLGIPGPYDTIWPDHPFETAWVFDLPPRRGPYRLLLPSDGVEIPLEFSET